MIDAVSTATNARINFRGPADSKPRQKGTKPGAREQRASVLIVDPHEVMRVAIAEWINSSPDLKVCGVAGGVTHAFWAILRFRPNVIVSEIIRPKDLGFIRELHRQHPRLPIVVFTSHEEALYGAKTRKAGAWRYVMKDAGGDNLVKTLLEVLRVRTARTSRSHSVDPLSQPGKTPGRIQQRADCENDVHKANLRLERSTAGKNQTSDE